MVNAVDMIWQHAADQGRSLAVKDGKLSWSYEDLRRRIASWAVRLRDAEVRHGDRVLLMSGTSAEYVAVYHGILAVGGVAVTVNPTSTHAELSHFLSDSGASLVIASAACEAAASAVSQPAGVDCWSLATHTVREAKSFTPDDLPAQAGAAILYTSGTTGRAKGAELSHGGIVASARSIIEALDVTTHDRWGSALPLFHVFGQVTVMRTVLHAGAAMSFLPKFDAVGLLDMTVEDRITVLAGVPTMWNAMINVPKQYEKSDFTSLRMAVSGGAGLPREISRAFEQRFGVALLSSYGLTETGAAGACDRNGRPPKPDSAGLIWPRVEVQILDDDRREMALGDVGEIAIRGAMVMNGYWNRPEATKAVMHDGWFLSGDLGKVDSDGYLWVVGRKKDLIIRGGYNIHPGEVEEALYEHPDVVEAVVVGLPDDHLGEEVAAVVVMRPGTDFQSNEMRAWMSERLAGYKTPRIYHVVDELPKGATGKLLRRAIDPAAVRAHGMHAGHGTR
jgi:long-chain acyl-CoA synthetase